MIVTEKEAKTKRCPESYGPPLSDHGMITAQPANQSIGYGYSMSVAVQTSPTHCIGSACMAWRTTGDEGDDGTPLGYCGKAGKP
jgi:hypothetical protein